MTFGLGIWGRGAPPPATPPGVAACTASHGTPPRVSRPPRGSATTGGRSPDPGVLVADARPGIGHMWGEVPAPGGTCGRFRPMDRSQAGGGPRTWGYLWPIVRPAGRGVSGTAVPRHLDRKAEGPASPESRGRIPVDEEEAPTESASSRGYPGSAEGFPEASGERPGPRSGPSGERRPPFRVRAGTPACRGPGGPGATPAPKWTASRRPKAAAHARRNPGLAPALADIFRTPAVAAEDPANATGEARLSLAAAGAGSNQAPVSPRSYAHGRRNLQPPASGLQSP